MEVLRVTKTTLYGESTSERGPPTGMRGKPAKFEEKPTNTLIGKCWLLSDGIYHDYHTRS